MLYSNSVFKSLHTKLTNVWKCPKHWCDYCKGGMAPKERYVLTKDLWQISFNVAYVANFKNTTIIQDILKYGLHIRSSMQEVGITVEYSL